DFDGPPCDAMFQSQAFEEFHGDKGLTILFANVINSANVRMVQGGCRLRLALKAGQRLRVTGDFFGQELESNEAVEPRIFSFINDTHAAAAELLNDSIVRDRLADHESKY